MLGNSLLSQFEAFDFQRRTIPFVDTPEKIAEVVAHDRRARARNGKRPLVFSSIVDEAMSAQLGHANALFLDLFQVFIAPLEAELAAKSSHAAGRSHGIANSHDISRAWRRSTSPRRTTTARRRAIWARRR